MLRACRPFLLLSLVLATSLRAEKPELSTRVFKWPSDYLNRGWPFKDTDQTAAENSPTISFRGEVKALPPRKVVREFLENQGITFPEGSSATFNPISGLLTVTNTQSSLADVEALASSLAHHSPATIACTLTVIEGPGELIRQANAAASRTSNASQELATLLDYAKNPGSNVRIVGDAFLETKSGTRATTQAVREHTYASDLQMDAKSRSSVIHDTRQIGLLLEYEPNLGADGMTIESLVSIELHPAPPSERQISVSEPIAGGTAEFPVTEIPGAQFITGVTSKDGGTKFLGITKPVGTPKQNADVLWAAFLTTTVRRVECLPFFKTTPPSKAAPTPPGMSAESIEVPDGLFEPFMEESQMQPWYVKKAVPLQTWFEASGVKPAKGAAAEHSNGVLSIINTPDNIERIASLTEECLRKSSKTLAFTLQTIQAPAAFLRDLAHQTTRSADDTAMLAAAEAAVARGEARLITLLFLETKSDNRATHEAVNEHAFISKFHTDAKGRPLLDFAMRPVGSVFQIDPTIGMNGRTVEITLEHEFHSSPPETRREHFRDPASNKPFEMPIVDFHSARTVTGLHMTKGGTKLISLNRPTAHSDADVLWATFLKCHLVEQFPKPRQTPAEKKKAAAVDPKAWNTRKYHIPPDFLCTGSGGQMRTAEERQQALETRHTAKTILIAAGIPFPEEASATFNPATSQLFVKNTNANLAMVDAYVESITKASPKTIVCTTHVLQGPGPLLRRLMIQAASKSDHRTELDELLAAVKADTVQHINTARNEVKAGTRSTSKQANEHTALKSVSMHDKGEPVFEQQMREVGFRTEIEPTVGSDGETIELTLSSEYHTAPPLEHREHLTDTQGRRLEFPLTDYFTSKVTTGITIPSGSARLLSLYKPTGKPEFEKEDILQAIFITCDILRAGE